MRTGAQRQCVTGLVVNEAANVPRPDDDRLRAILHEAARHGPDVANRHGHPDFRAHLLGRIAWAGAGNDARAAKLERAFAATEWWRATPRPRASDAAAGVACALRWSLCAGVGAPEWTSST